MNCFKWRININLYS